MSEPSLQIQGINEEIIKHKRVRARAMEATLDSGLSPEQREAKESIIVKQTQIITSLKLDRERARVKAGLCADGGKGRVRYKPKQKVSSKYAWRARRWRN